MADLQFQMTKSIRSTKVFNLSELALIAHRGQGETFNRKSCQRRRGEQKVILYNNIIINNIHRD